MRNSGAFYGILFDAKTGKLYVDVITDNSKVITESDYVDSFWTTDYISFLFTNSHLQASIL